jgi:hypothetical protein
MTLIYERRKKQVMKKAEIFLKKKKMEGKRGKNNG